MSARLVLVVAILFPLAAPAQRSRSATAKCSVAGSVVRAGDNQPIKKATVFLMSADYDDKNPDHPRSYSATTEANGAFVIEGIDPGPYRLTIERNGYVLDSKARKVRILRLEPGERIRDLLLPM